MDAFQSHAGSIEAILEFIQASPILSFNPTLVRLRRRSWGGSGLRIHPFQSHAGSIEAFSPPYGPERPDHVSIPRWFD